MPHYPNGQAEAAEYTYTVDTRAEKLVIDYLNISIFDVQEMPIDLYLYFMRESYIYMLSQTENGRKYLEDCYRMTQTKPDRKKIREKIKSQKGT
mgnify:CR=1 FL=1|nr:MAG TPA: hypothetical protein [Caudoviricetes sp.]